MTTNEEMVDLLDEEIKRVKYFTNANGFHHGTAIDTIVRRYRNELKELRQIVYDDLSKDGVVNYE